MILFFIVNQASYSSMQFLIFGAPLYSSPLQQPILWVQQTKLFETVKVINLFL